MIADGHRVDPIVLRLIHAAAGERVILVSDASAPAAAPEGEYRLAGRAVHRDAAGVVRSADGRIAGSGILLDDAVREWAHATGATEAAALAAATIRPAGAIGLAAGLRSGGPADLVLTAVDGRVERVMPGGRWVAADDP